VFVCLSVCLLAYLKNRTPFRLHEIFCTRYEWPWLGHPLTTVEYVMLPVFTGSIARSATRPYLSYSEAILRFFAPQGRHFAPIGVKFDMKEGTNVPSSMRSPPPCQISPHRCNDKGIGPPKLKFLLRFDQNVKYKRLAGAYPLRDFHKICRIFTLFQYALVIKISLDFLNRLWSYGGFKFTGSGYPQF